MIWFGIILPDIAGVILAEIISQSGVSINMNIVWYLIYLLGVAIVVELVLFILIKFLYNPIHLESYSTDDGICYMRVYNKDKTKKLEDCWCRSEKVFDFPDGKERDITEMKDKDNLKFLWMGTDQEKMTISYDDHEILNIAKPNPRNGKMFFDILYSRGEDSFQIWKNDDGQYEGKTRIKFRVFGKQEGGLTYSRSITKNIVLKTYNVEGEQKEQIIDLRFTD